MTPSFPSLSQTRVANRRSILPREGRQICLVRIAARRVLRDDGNDVGP